MTKEISQRVASEVLSTVLIALPPGRYHVSKVLPAVILGRFQAAEVWFQSKSDLSYDTIVYDSVSGWFEKFE